MKFPKSSCMKIVQEISDIIGERVNMMDHEGMIIASTDPARIGTFHAGAKRVVDEKLEILTIHDDEEYTGAKPGLNLPIEFQNDIIGVIGVTGPEKKVGKYGQIIKKMTEILLLDISMRKEMDVEQRIRARFLNDWIHGLPQEINRQMVENGRQIGIDITLPRRILLVSIIPREGAATVALQRVIDAAEGSVRKVLAGFTEAIVFKSGSALVCLVSRAEDARMLEWAGVLKARIEENQALCVCIGIDDPVANFVHINTAYQHAQKALRTCLRSPSKDIRLYDSINMEIFSGEIPDMIKLEYVRRIFRDCTWEEIAGWIPLLDTYYACDGSIARASQALYIHKNTLQYRLRQLYEKTGYDPRSIRFSSLYYNAIHFYHDLGGKMALEGETEPANL
ncbi:MAG: sugar diacid recognition domain-containing protein [Candidatus Limiplasma sp.]|nr:sugar diacid recognition domain-containing protein [Candidatus Limiplasma sp.]